ncbi:MAG TPA: GNAT family N-acetyltransferase [Vicinamibacteria bacterium]|jgi:GNAT superfamily N-acetyltransferase
MAVSPVEVVRRTPEHDDEIFRLYGEVFGERRTADSRARWRWQYLDNPAGDGAPEIWVARDGRAILGQYASMPVRLWWGGREVRSSWGMDVFLREQARGRGVGAQLFTAWSDHVEVALGLGLTESSYGLFKKLRFRDVGPVPFYWRWLDPKAVARRRLGRVLGTAAGAVLEAAASADPPADPAITVSTIDGFDDRYDALWERARGTYRMCVRRDAGYLDWKYVRCPHRRYDLREAVRGGALAGFAVSRHEEDRGLVRGWIVDLFAAADDHAARGALLGATLGSFRQAGVGRVQAFAMSRAVGEDLRRFGFRRGRSPMQFCVRARADEGRALEHPEDWHVVFGDSDMDR